jgi:hypothetical protein
MTKKFTVQCYVTYSQAYEVEAENEQEAIEKAQWLDVNVDQLVFIGTDSYEVLMGHSDEVLDLLKKQYVTSDVVSGEFIYSAQIPSMFAEDEARYGIQQFLDWDESPATFDLEANNPFWIIKETNS